MTIAMQLTNTISFEETNTIGYKGLRGLSLLFLPYADDLTKLALFGVVYGLDWIATVPPTVGLATDLFGTRSGPILFGWVFFGHQVGAALAAYGGGLLRVGLGTYRVAFTTAGLLALGAAVLVLTIRQGRGPVADGLPPPDIAQGHPVSLGEPRVTTTQEVGAGFLPRPLDTSQDGQIY